MGRREGGILVESKKWRRKLFHALRMSGVTRLLCAIISQSFNKVGKRGRKGGRAGGEGGMEGVSCFRFNPSPAVGGEFGGRGGRESEVRGLISKVTCLKRRERNARLHDLSQINRSSLPVYFIYFILVYLSLSNSLNARTPERGS